MVAFKLNGKDVSADAPPTAPLLTVLANDLNAFGPKYGCGRAQCGSCTVLIDGAAVRSCVTPASTANGRQVTTLEGLREGAGPGKLQRAFIAEQAAQCGYCAAGIIMQAQALLNRNPKPTEADVRSALDGNLCRCGAHNRIVRAVLRASKEA
jgi:aerobic-type carbon monoxide dehydrogenase small subunit (CoxS/CutS family)